jgi:hypothetical protein
LGSVTGHRAAGVAGLVAAESASIAAKTAATGNAQPNPIRTTEVHHEFEVGSAHATERLPDQRGLWH